MRARTLDDIRAILSDRTDELRREFGAAEQWASSKRTPSAAGASMLGDWRIVSP